MATLRPLPVPQDENDVVHGHRVKFDGSNDGPGFPSGKGLGGARTGGGAFSKTPGKGLASGRKALGDISNRTGELGAKTTVLRHLGATPRSLNNAGLGKTPGKTPGGSKPARRVLGDITNATPAKQQAGGAPAEQAAAKPAAAPPQAAPAAKPREKTYADDGLEPERLAGKGWQQLEAERLRREGAAGEARARNAVLPWAVRRLPLQDLSLEQLMQRSAALEREPVPPCPPSPYAPASRTQAGGFGGAAFLASSACAEDLLPEIDEAALLAEFGLEDADGD